MEDHTPVDKPISNWAVAAGLLAFAAAYLLWAIGFDLIATWIQASTIETVLNWISNFWYWVAIGVFVLALIASKLKS